VGSVIFLGLVLAATQVLCPALSEQLGVDVWELPSVARALDAQEQRRQVLERRMEAALHRHDARKRISEDLIDRRISLDEAVLLTGSLSGAADNFSSHLRRSMPGATDEERLYYHVIAWACDVLKEQPGRAAALRDRLLADMMVRFPQSAGRNAAFDLHSDETN
jgi:hypothetical protein